MNKEENKYSDLETFNLTDDDLFGRYCDIEMLLYGSEGNQYHRFKIIGRLNSNYYNDIPFNDHTRPAYIHDKCIDVVNVIHCGIDESKVFRVPFKNIKILSNKLDLANKKLDKIKEYCIVEKEDINGSKCDDILSIIDNEG